MLEVTLLLALRSNNTVLLGRKKTGRLGMGTFNGPGGHREPGESLLECMVRETREEIGLDVDPHMLTKCAVLDCYANGAVYMRVHVFLARDIPGEPVETESMKPHWWPVHQLPFEQMFEADALWLPQVLKGERILADLHYHKPGEGLGLVVYYPLTDEL
jgi:8-oxo-dGTP diphosphatase